MFLVEHVFEVSVEGVKGLVLGDHMIWGEADCFIQYHFPTQVSSKQQSAQAQQIDGRFFISHTHTKIKLEMTSSFEYDVADSC